MIIDAYSHGLHGDYLDQLADAGGEWTKKVIAAERLRALDRPQMLNVQLRLEQLDRYGIDMQVVTPSNYWNIDCFPGNTKERLAVTRALNDNMARLMEDSKGRLPAIASMTLASFGPGHHHEMERAIRTLGLKGVCIQSNINGKPLDAPEFESFWSQVAEMDIPVYIHPQDPAQNAHRSYEVEYDLIHNFGWPFETVLMLTRLVFSGVMERYPGLKIVSHHLGEGMVPFFWGRILETYAPDEQPRLIGRTIPRPLFDYFSRFYYDTAVGGNAAAIRCAYEVFGADQLIFATDAPFGPSGGLGRLQTYPDVIKSLGLSGEENKKNLPKTPARFFV